MVTFLAQSIAVRCGCAMPPKHVIRLALRHGAPTECEKIGHLRALRKPFADRLCKATDAAERAQLQQRIEEIDEQVKQLFGNARRRIRGEGVTTEQHGLCKRRVQHKMRAAGAEVANESAGSSGKCTRMSAAVVAVDVAADAAATTALVGPLAAAASGHAVPTCADSVDPMETTTLVAPGTPTQRGTARTRVARPPPHRTAKARDPEARRGSVAVTRTTRGESCLDAIRRHPVVCKAAALVDGINSVSDCESIGHVTRFFSTAVHLQQSSRVEPKYIPAILALAADFEGLPACYRHRALYQAGWTEPDFWLARARVFKGLRAGDPSGATEAAFAAVCGGGAAVLLPTQGNAV